MGANGSAPQSPTTGEDGAIESSRQSLATDDSAASHRALERQRLEMFATTVREHTRCSRVLCAWGEKQTTFSKGKDTAVPPRSRKYRLLHKTECRKDSGPGTACAFLKQIPRPAALSFHVCEIPSIILEPLSYQKHVIQFYENGELCDITLKVELVARACCEYMKLHFQPSSCLAVRVFAESHSRTDLMDMVDQYACEHFPEVVECEDFAHLPLLPVDFLMGAVAKEQIVKENLKCRDLLDEARNYHLHLSSRAVPDSEYSFRTTPRKHTAGVLFYVGGQGGSGDPFRSIECYSINKNSWFFGPETNS
ncbi:hypothetical protein E2I00_006264 [Balaenoptera physalus]|uniref:BACK domain-containing protein n=1 Tax=Balaenoptera physalus TaxID=9770 RepID=A0A643CG59_BALPH|nr:hypothetical protein E2I00_006264 [Balaenoptera physalus]